MDAERARYLELFTRALASPGPYAETCHGRGIVTCGSLKFTPYLWILIRSLRHAGCTLPIELWHMAGEINEPLRRWLEPYGVTFRDAGQQPWSQHHAFNGAHGIKPYAVIHSAFQEVLFLDADNSVCRDPAFLFESPEYAASRALFWSDPAPMTGRLGGGDLRRDFGLAAGRDEFESGQFLVDKAQCWPALLATLHLNEFSGYYYQFLFGDKETFRLAFDATKTPYRLIRQPPQAPARDWRAKGHVQYWTDDRPLFYHRVGAKWERDVTRRENHELSHLPSRLVDEMFDELQRRWTDIMPVRERVRPYAGMMRRLVQPHWSRPYFGWVRSSARIVTERGRRAKSP